MINILNVLVMQTKTPESIILFGVILKVIVKQLKVWALVFTFLAGSNWIDAQLIFNVNSDNYSQKALLSSGQMQVTDNYLGTSVRAREFEFNPKLISFTKVNEGDNLLLDFFEDKRFNGNIQNVTRYINGVTGITSEKAGVTSANSVNTLSATSVVLTVAGMSDVFGISISSLAGGSVSISSPSSSNGSLVPVAETVTLTVTEDFGYELKKLKVYKTLDSSVKVTLDDIGGIFSFIMPDYSVTISATFGYSDDQQAVLNAKNAINSTTDFTVSQEDVSDEATLKVALGSAINTLLADEGINYTVVAKDITVINVTYPTQGTADKMLGTDDVRNADELKPRRTTSYEATGDNDDLLATKMVIESVNYTATQADVQYQSQARDKVEAIIAGLNLSGVRTEVIDGLFLAAVEGEAGSLNGKNGCFEFKVNLNNGSGTELITGNLILLITAIPYNPAIMAAKEIIENANYVAPQLTVPDITKAREAVEAIISTLSLNGVSISLIDGMFTEAIAGTVGAPSGKDGNYTFIVELHKDEYFHQSTDLLILTITSTPFTPTDTYLVTVSLAVNGLVTVYPANPVSENEIVTLTIIPAEGYETDDVSAYKSNDLTEIVTVNEKGNSRDFLMPSFDVTVEATFDKTADQNDLEEAIQLINNMGIVSNDAANVITLIGTGDSRTFLIPSHNVTVEATFKKTTDQIKVEEALQLINNTTTAYDPIQENGDIMEAKAIVESATYITSQINAPDMAGAKVVVEAIISTLPLHNVTTNVIDDVYTPAIAGTTATPNGTDGSYTFTVELTKGLGTMETTFILTLTISATPYTHPGAYILSISLTTHGTVSADPANPVVENAPVTLAVTPAAGYELDGIIAYKSIDPTEVVILTGNGNTRSFQMPSFDVTVEATFVKTAAQLDVETAISLIESMNNTFVLQETANTEVNVKAWLVLQINNLPGMDLTGIVVDANDITLGGFTPATIGTPANLLGVNGSFTFFVTLTKTTEKTTVRSGVILAIAYSAVNYTIAIESTVNGTITPNQTNATAGTSILLDIVPAQGYELDIISAYKTGDAINTVSLTETGTSREFTMPAYDVTVYATFRKTVDQLAVEAAKTAIENMYNPIVSMSAANTEATVKTWLTHQINALPDNDIVITVTDITLSNFSAAVAGSSGNIAGTNGSFTFMVSLKKGNSTIATVNKNGIITATSFEAPFYSIYFEEMSNGEVTVVRDYAAEGETVTLTIAPDQGYELESLTATPSVTLFGSGAIRTFVMPANYVIFSVTFKKTQEQLETEALETLAAAIEGGSFRIAQGTGNTVATVRTWLFNTLRVMFSEPYDIQPGMLDELVIKDVTITTLMPAVQGDASNPSGTNGSFTFTVSLQVGSSMLMTLETDGTIVAIPYSVTPVKRIELLQINDLTVRILNTGNVETGALKLELSGVTADALSLTESTVNSLSVGGETDIVLWLRLGLDIGVYKATLVVSGENLPATSLEITYTVTVTGNDDLPPNVLKAWIQTGMLHVSGLTVGQTWSVYGISGVLVHSSTAASGDAKIALPYRGVYIVISGTNTVKVMF